MLSAAARAEIPDGPGQVFAAGQAAIGVLRRRRGRWPALPGASRAGGPAPRRAPGGSPRGCGRPAARSPPPGAPRAPPARRSPRRRLPGPRGSDPRGSSPPPAPRPTRPGSSAAAPGGKHARRISGNPTRASSASSTRSHAATISAPPPRHAPDDGGERDGGRGDERLQGIPHGREHRLDRGRLGRVLGDVDARRERGGKPGQDEQARVARGADLPREGVRGSPRRAR